MHAVQVLFYGEAQLHAVQLRLTARPHRGPPAVRTPGETMTESPLTALPTARPAGCPF
ncbi:hypothetical protein HYE82_27800, partial [Streptomyces sp. BR123]|nr:hypothetical protein [Streptomyces sp. BR123]